MNDRDRKVHAISAANKHGRRLVIVRYERRGKWAIEFETEPHNSKQCSLFEAADVAAKWVKRGGEVFPGQSGGSRFDKLVADATAPKVKAKK